MSFSNFQPLPFPTSPRARKDAEREKPAPAVDIGRLYAALLTERTKPPQPIKRSLEENDDPCRNDMDARLSAALGSGGGIASLMRGWHPCSRTEGHTHRRQTLSNNRRKGRKSRSNNEFDFETSKRSGAGASLREQNYLGDEGHQHQANEKHSEGCAETSGTSDPCARGAVENSVAEVEAWVTGTEGESAKTVADGGWVICDKYGKEHEANVDDGVQQGWVKGGGNDCTGGKGQRQQHQQLPDACIRTNKRRSSTDDSDGAKESLEPKYNVAGKSEDGLLAGGNGTSVGHGGAAGRGLADAHAALEGGDISEESVAAAIRIETCWRGFHARCIARCALRSVLLNALRKIGGGKMSKVNGLKVTECGKISIEIHPPSAGFVLRRSLTFLNRCFVDDSPQSYPLQQLYCRVSLGRSHSCGGQVLALTDIEREEKKGLTRALRVATLPQHQLPPQVMHARSSHKISLIVDCAYAYFRRSV